MAVALQQHYYFPISRADFRHLQAHGEALEDRQRMVSGENSTDAYDTPDARRAERLARKAEKAKDAAHVQG